MIQKDTRVAIVLIIFWLDYGFGGFMRYRELNYKSNVLSSDQKENEE